MGDFLIYFILGTPVAFASYCAILYERDKKRRIAGVAQAKKDESERDAYLTYLRAETARLKSLNERDLR